MARMSSEEKTKFFKTREEFDRITHFMNQIEEELLVNKEERQPDMNKISVAYGKATTSLLELADLLEIYTKNTN